MAEKNLRREAGEEALFAARETLSENQETGDFRPENESVLAEKMAKLPQTETAEPAEVGKTAHTPEARELIAADSSEIAEKIISGRRNRKVGSGEIEDDLRKFMELENRRN